MEIKNNTILAQQIQPWPRISRQIEHPCNFLENNVCMQRVLVIKYQNNTWFDPKKHMVTELLCPLLPTEIFMLSEILRTGHSESRIGTGEAAGKRRIPGSCPKVPCAIGSSICRRCLHALSENPSFSSTPHFIFLIWRTPWGWGGGCRGGGRKVLLWELPC